LIQGSFKDFDSSRFGNLVNSALSSGERQVNTAGNVLVVSSIASVAWNSTYYKVVVELILNTGSPLELLEKVAGEFASYQGFEENGYNVASIIWYMQGIATPTGNSTSGPSRVLKGKETSNVNVIYIVVPVVVGSAIVVAIIFGIVYYKKKKQQENEFRFRRAVNRRYGRGAVGRGPRPDIWLDMDSLPMPGNA